MNVFLAGTDVSQVVDLLDADGNQLNVSSISYRVTDETETEVIALTALAGFAANSPQATIAIPAASNTLTGVTRGLRAIELHCIIAGNTVVLLSSYVIQTADPLAVGVNTFQSLAQADFVATMVPNTPGWDAATSTQKIGALIEARTRICRLNFSPINSNKFWGQDMLNFVPEGTREVNYINGQLTYLFGGDLSMVTPDQFKKLPQMLLDALNLAQIAEADVILAGDTIDSRRAEGLVLDTIGESKQMFRTSKPLDLGVSRRALRYLARFITFSKRIARN